MTGIFLIQKPNGQTECIFKSKRKAAKYCDGKKGYIWEEWGFYDEER